MNHVLVASVMVFAAAAQADAASVRPAVTLAGPDVRLSDLFEGAGTDRILGRAPPPGQRLTIEVAQLAAIARQFNVAWRPETGGERVVLERPGRPLSREAAVGAVRAALAAAGAPAEIEIEIAAWAPPMVSPGTAATTVSVINLDYDRASGKFATSLSVVADDGTSATVRLVGQAWETLVLPVARARLLPGNVVQAGDVELHRVRALSVREEVATRVADIVGRALRRAAQAGQPVALADLMAPILVRKGAQVAMSLDSPGIVVTARGLALDPGAAGARIRVQNPTSRAVMEAVVVGEDQVRIAPDTAPLTAGQGGPRGGGSVLPRLALQ